MSATFNKFDDFSQQLAKGNHNFGSDVFKVALTNVLPVSAQVSLDLVTNNVAPTNTLGYSPTATTVTVSDSSGTTTVQGTQVVFTASGGAIGPFQYAILYNDTASPKYVIGWFNYASSISLADTETFTVKFNNSSPGTLFTLV